MDAFHPIVGPLDHPSWEFGVGINAQKGSKYTARAWLHHTLTYKQQT